MTKEADLQSLQQYLRIVCIDGFLVESTYQHVDSLFHAIAYAPSTALKVCLSGLYSVESTYPPFA